MYLLGFDIGGTKCAVVTARYENESIELLKKLSCPTDHSVSAREMIERLCDMADTILQKQPDSIGISCGGPLDSAKGVILSPPNLPAWDSVPIVEIISNRYNTRAILQNDANACAVAEWKFGAGRGTKNMVFMTFGTGLGAGLIIDGKLYDGTNGNAGELGHIRLAQTGPVGYGKRGSFEGFCSGGGIKQLGEKMAQKSIKKGYTPLYFEDNNPDSVTAKSIAEAARLGDPTALEVFKISGKFLGRGLSIIIDVLNPEKIVIGSIFARSRDLLWDEAEKIIKKEALPFSTDCCEVVAAELGENIGDFAAIATSLLT
ncbi:MAG: ROK family protein [Clostridia bacterium]|nr:ROK family protein [Clostridia bacterium]